IAMLVLPHGQDPAGFCARADLLQRAAGASFGVSSPPVLWVAGSGPSSDAAIELPIWWAGGAWHQFAQKAPVAYTPRKFEPCWRRGSVLSHPAPSPIEAGPGEIAALPESGVMQVMKVLLCQRGGRLWSKPLLGGEWRPLR
ncbi:unnamed protein product, partial [Effrenium voratum]